MALKRNARTSSCADTTLRVLLAISIFLTLVFVVLVFVWVVNPDEPTKIVGRACVVDTSGPNGTFVEIPAATPTNPILSDPLEFNVIKKDAKGGFNHDNAKKYTFKDDGVYRLQTHLTLQVSSCSPVAVRLIKQNDGKKAVLSTRLVEYSGTWDLGYADEQFDDDDQAYVTLAQYVEEGCNTTSYLALTNDCGANEFIVWLSK